MKIKVNELKIKKLKCEKKAFEVLIAYAFRNDIARVANSIFESQKQNVITDSFVGDIIQILKISSIWETIMNDRDELVLH